MDRKEELIQQFLATDPSVYQANPELLALWYDGHGDWEKSHEQVDHLSGKKAALVHAYLHRKEGDQWNADYWYTRAGETRPNIPIQEEWESITLSYLESEGN